MPIEVCIVTATNKCRGNNKGELHSPPLLTNIITTY